MAIHTILLFIHLIGLALGLGGATVSDIMFFRAIGDKKIDDAEYSTLKVLSRIIWVGLSLLILSGFGFFYLIYQENNGSLPLLALPRWQAKLTLVGMVLINGLVFFKFVFKKLSDFGAAAITNPTMWLLATTGTISVVSWYSIVLISVSPRTFVPSYGHFLAVYLLLLFLGIIFSRTMLKRKLT